MVKVACRELPVFAVVMGRSVVIAVVAWGVARARGVGLRPHNPRLLAWRCVSGFAAMCCYFTAISLVPLANAVTLQYTAPLWVALLAGAVLGERVGAGRRGWIAAAFCGVCLLVGPDLARLELGALFALASAVLAAFAYLAVRGLSPGDPPERIVLVFALFSLVASAPALLWLERLPRPDELLALAGVGLGASVGQLGMTHAYRHAEASFISPFSYGTILFSAALGWWLFAEQPGLAAAAGATLIVVAGIAISATSVNGRGQRADRPRGCRGGRSE
jgi:drug/metabolite transporter (DMT)-like permease